MRTLSRHIILIFFFGFLLVSPGVIKGQTGYKSVDEMKAKAAEYFAADQFDLAFPLYSQLLSLDSKNPDLNYRFGVCLMHTDRANTEGPIAYLEMAINKVADIDLYYHLAVVYHTNYFFTDAIYNYRKYLQLANNKARKDYDVEHKIAMCQNGIEMLKAVDDLYVIQKYEVDRKSFYRSYNLLDYGGRILNIPNEFLRKADLKNQDDKVAYFNPKAKLLFYALDNKNQKDIYYSIRNYSGEWTEGTLLSSVINTPYDEDYPILMPDGITLYFSSKGHNSMGGFDIFQSVYDTVSKEWSKPVNLSFPFNTPSDDILFISNADETIAWFASNRNSASDKISVYKVGIIKKEKQTTDLSDVYAKGNLSGADLGKIKNMAQLDINISDKQFKEIPVDQKKKLEALVKNDAVRITQNIHQVNLKNIDKQIAFQESQTDLTDSVKTIVLQVDTKLETLKSIYLHTQDIVSAKAGVVQQRYTELSGILEKAQKTDLINRRKEYINEANKALFKTLRLEFEHDKLSRIGHQIDNQIASQRDLLAQVTTIFGDIQKNIVTRQEKETRENIKRLDHLIRSADTLTDYSKIVNYTNGSLYNIQYPSNLLNENSFAVYYLQKESGNAPILSNDTRFATYIPEAIELAASTSIANVVPSKPEITESKIAPKPENNRATQEIRENLSNLNKLQANSISQLEQQSALLTQKASKKLDASNAALLDFEHMRDQYNNGQITDQNTVIAKQTESQNLLYQSLAINGFIEKLDSLTQVVKKQKEGSNDQIFAIEQALQSNQIEKAQALYRALEKSISLPTENTELLVQGWIKTGVANVPNQKILANQAFEFSQKLTDESIQLFMEAKDLKESANNKTNAFKRREINIEAENKENLAVQKQNQADNQLAYGTNLYEKIKRAEAILPIASEFSSSESLAVNTNLLLNPEKRKNELSDRLVAREKDIVFKPDASTQLLSKENNTKLDLKNIPEMHDLIAYETKRFKAQLLAEELDINKRETVLLLEIGKTLNGSEANENTKKIAELRKEAIALQEASVQAFQQTGIIYNQLSAEDKKQADTSKDDFESYLKNVRNRIAQLLDDVTLLGEQMTTTTDESRRKNLRRQADQKEQIAMYLILEEYEIIAKRNNQSYRKNALVINKLNQENLSKQQKDLMQAIFAQIESFMQQVNGNRIKAKNGDLSFMLTKVLLQDAFTLENSALDLQFEAIRMMREKDTKSMLAYQSKDKRAVQPELLTSNDISAKPSVYNTAAQKLIDNNNTKINANAQTRVEEFLKPLGKEEIKTAAIDTKESSKTENQSKPINQKITKPEEKTILAKTETKEIDVKAISNPLSDSFNSIELPKMFPVVSLGKEPTGTQFSVQIAAIGGLKTTDNFLNVMELFALKDSEKELYRYFSGRFSSLKAAIIRRNSLRQQGYADAFIKSWKEGKIVNMLEAAGELDDATAALLNETIISLPSQYQNINFSATNISQLNGVYYSVQVGVYSRPRSSAQLFGIKPLYHNRLKNGHWVYFNGIFKSIADAEENKIKVRAKGVPDAFVVAFKEGEKVSLITARRALSQGLNQPAAEDIIILTDAAIAVDEQLKAIVGPSFTSPKNRIYKVQIGVYSHAVSLDWVSAKLIPPAKVENHKSATGKYIYTVGSFKTYEEAAEFNTKQVKELIKDAFIVTFENDQKINRN